MIRKLVAVALAAALVPAVAFAQDSGALDNVADAICAEDGALLKWLLGGALGLVGGASALVNFRSRLPAWLVAALDALALNFVKTVKDAGKGAPVLLALVVAASLTACAAVDATKQAIDTKQPVALDPAKVAADREMALYLMHAAGCDVGVLSGAAAPIVTIAAGPAGGVALQAVSAAGQVACAVPVTVPATALPSAQAAK
jgi:hypothetical protein